MTLRHWLESWRALRFLPLLESQMKDHERRIQEIEKELDLANEPSEFGNKLQKRRYLELLKDTPLSEDEKRQWEAGT